MLVLSCQPPSISVNCLSHSAGRLQGGRIETLTGNLHCYCLFFMPPGSQCIGVVGSSGQCSYF